MHKYEINRSRALQLHFTFTLLYKIEHIYKTVKVAHYSQLFDFGTKLKLKHWNLIKRIKTTWNNSTIQQVICEFICELWHVV